MASTLHGEQRRPHCQMVVARVEEVSFEEVSELGETVRGDGGFGHTGTVRS